MANNIPITKGHLDELKKLQMSRCIECQDYIWHNQGETHYFCSEECCKRYNEHQAAMDYPEAYDPGESL